jgi:hypothetical protein
MTGLVYSRSTINYLLLRTKAVIASRDAYARGFGARRAPALAMPMNSLRAKAGHRVGRGSPDGLKTYRQPGDQHR